MKSEHKWSQKMHLRWPSTFDEINREFNTNFEHGLCEQGTKTTQEALNNAIGMCHSLTMMLMKAATEERKEHPSGTCLLACNDA